MRTVTVAMAVLAAALLVMGIGPPDHANGQGNGPPWDDLAGHPALYGLCTAYFAGEGGENGNKNDAPPFQALQEAADEDQDAEDGEGDVEEFCEGVRPSNGQGNGNQDDSNAPDPTESRGEGDGNGRGTDGD